MKPINRDSEQYKEKTYAFELVTSPVWKFFLEPLLDSYDYDQARPIKSLDDALDKNYRQGRIAGVKEIKRKIINLYEDALSKKKG